MQRINDALEADPVDIATLKELAISADGLITNDLRRKVWPKLLNVNVYDIQKTSGKRKGECHNGAFGAWGTPIYCMSYGVRDVPLNGLWFFPL